MDLSFGSQRLSRRRRRVQVFGLVITSVLALLCAFWNTVEMRQELEYNTREYGREVSSQMRDTVRLSIDNKLTELKNVADSISQVSGVMDGEELTEFLTRKANILGFHTIYFMGEQGNILAQATHDCSSQEKHTIEASLLAQNLIKTEAQVGFLEGQTLYYSAPVPMKTDCVLIGIRDRDAMKRLITSGAFQSSTLSCIVDSQGSAVLLPDNVAAFSDLDSIVDQETDQELRQMIRDMEAGRAGTVWFTSTHEEELLMAYNPIGINDWFMLTIVPVDLMTGRLDTYFLRTALVVAGLAVMFALLSAWVYWDYKRSQRELSRLAYQDPITQGPNAEAFRLHCRHLRHQGRFSGCTVVLMNVRRFKMINNKLGFESGNEIFRIILLTLTRALDPQKGEAAARCEMDNFFLCLREEEEQTIRCRLQAMMEAVNQEVEARFPGNRLSFLVGCAKVDRNDLDARNFLDQARLASQGEEALQADCVFYHEGSMSRLKREQELEARFPQSLEQGDFQVYLQPKVDLASGCLSGAEALVRWKHPELGLISPGEFIPMLERTGKIVQLDFEMFRQVCRFYHQRQEAGKPWYPVSVNLSRCHFYEENFLDKFAQEAQFWNLPPGAVEFELTESMFFDESHNQRIKDGITQMHRLGFRCSMDDFGSGYSSLGILKEFDVDTLKIDRSFFLDIASQKAQGIIRSVVELASKLHMETVAEGIEEKEQMEFLRSIHCTTLQGYYFSRPLPMAEFEAWAAQYEGNNI